MLRRLFTLRRRERPEDEEGFTLVELMVVIVIIGLLATIVAINVLPNLGKANTGKARSDVGTLEQAMEFYRLDNMSYPRTEQGLAALVTAPAGLAQPARYRAGGYIKKLPQDPWCAPYVYANPGTHGGPFDIYSLGADGQPGGEGEDADIGSWQ
jgi:general secretion pathway protein G